MNHGGVCRTAPATLGLLIRNFYYQINLQQYGERSPLVLAVFAEELLGLLSSPLGPPWVAGLGTGLYTQLE